MLPILVELFEQGWGLECSEDQNTSVVPHALLFYLCFFVTGIQSWVLFELYCMILITHVWQKEQAECDQSRWTCSNMEYICCFYLEVGQTPGKWSPCGQSLSREDDILMDKSSDCVWKMSSDEEYGVKWCKKAPEKRWVYIVHTYMQTCIHSNPPPPSPTPRPLKLQTHDCADIPSYTHSDTQIQIISEPYCIVWA